MFGFSLSLVFELSIYHSHFSPFYPELSNLAQFLSHIHVFHPIYHYLTQSIFCPPCCGFSIEWKALSTCTFRKEQVPYLPGKSKKNISMNIFLHWLSFTKIRLVHIWKQISLSLCATELKACVKYTHFRLIASFQQDPHLKLTSKSLVCWYWASGVTKHSQPPYDSRQTMGGSTTWLVCGDIKNSLFLVLGGLHGGLYMCIDDLNQSHSPVSGE